jgi:hypothetical protein
MHKATLGILAVNRAQVADALDEALTKYLCWDVYHHQEGL